MKATACRIERRQVSILASILGALLLLAMSDCGSVSIRQASDGIVVGGIVPCEGIPIENGPRYGAGKVDVLRGNVTWKDAGHGDKLLILPPTLVAEETVVANGTYRFELPAGSYVLRADLPPPANVQPWVSVEVKSRASVRRDIPNMCI